MKKDIIELAKVEKEKYKTLLSKIEKEIKQAPKGELHVKKCRGKYVQFYVRYLDKTGRKVDEYIHQKEVERVRALAQKEYNIKLKSYLSERINIYNCITNTTKAVGLKDIYTTLHPAKQPFVNPIIKSDEQFIEDWKQKNSGDQNSMEKKIKLKTMQGEIVRSKSEKIIADMFYEEGIPYIYEPQIIFKDKTMVIPDFLTLNVKERKAYAFEHFGMMSDESYAKKNIQKIKRYEENGYWFGDNILYTFEVGDDSIDVDNVQRIIDKYLK